MFSSLKYWIIFIKTLYFLLNLNESDDAQDTNNHLVGAVSINNIGQQGQLFVFTIKSPQ